MTRLPRIKDSSPFPGGKSYGVLDWPELHQKRDMGESLKWYGITLKEINDGLLEFTGESVPKDYWKNFKSDSQKASEVIGGKDFVVRKNPGNQQWEIARYLPEIQEIPVEKPETKDTEEPQGEFLEGFDYEEEERVKPQGVEPESASPPPEPTENKFVEPIDYPEEDYQVAN